MRPIKGRDGSGDFVKCARSDILPVFIEDNSTLSSGMCYSIFRLSVCCIHNPQSPAVVLQSQALPPREMGFVTLCKSPSVLLSSRLWFHCLNAICTQRHKASGVIRLLR
ncbi:hypothetical protein ABG768_007452 [Culter alburnus]|uniref:Uncharacterized protein n=1 Tax=Culter alburnus TaxID=194366 RepID=A0AAW1ZMJ5_CULAL